MNWGGKREGAGRKPSKNPKITWAVRVTAQEREKLKNYLAKIRSTGK